MPTGVEADEPVTGRYYGKRRLGQTQAGSERGSETSVVSGRRCSRSDAVKKVLDFALYGYEMAQKPRSKGYSSGRLGLAKVCRNGIGHFRLAL